MNKEITIDLLPGDHFKEVSKKAFDIAIEQNCIVRFNFNNITCLVTANTFLDGLSRDRENAYLMGWNTIGPDCALEYDLETEIEVCTKRLERAIRRKEDWESYNKNV